ncbi:pentatricopeptide repeat-containing protein At1g26900, mitochondrial [Primulina eburnea]|uniref:pentatricopeptide repeat-containing protein At1g26900, mitochondrial n=1 Tax=Primulina eburnea TaxID=1245227 RepID=UPI003C6C1567
MSKRYINTRLSEKFKVWSTNNRYDTTISSDHHHQKLISLLQSCKKTSQTAQIHGLMIKAGLDHVPFPLSKLLAHSSLQDISYADSIFKNVKSPNIYMFNVMLRGYSISDEPKTGIVLFNRMRVHSWSQDFLFDQFTYVSVLKCCACLVAGWTGIGVHSIALKSGFDLFLNVKNSLLRFYCVCGGIEDAHRLFVELGDRKDLVSWNILMGGYLCASKFDVVIDLFRKLYRDGFSVSVTTVLGVLSAISETINVSLAKSVHMFCVKVGFLLDLNVATSLISMYGKHGFIDSARQIFDETDIKNDVVLWNCLIDGYVNIGLLEEAVELVRSMEQSRLKPNSSTLVSLLSACSASGALALGQYIHDYVEELQLKLDVVLGTALIDMYAKSGLLEKATDVFDKMENKDVKTWTAMISGLGVHGQAKRADLLFQRMEEQFVPNEVTFLAVLNCCSHGGLVMEGISYFRRMVTVYGLNPKTEHYGCLIDLLGRAGLLEEAYDLMKELTLERDATAWRALLGACRVYGKVDLVGRVKRELDNNCDEHPADLLSVSGTYTAAGMIPPNGDKWESEDQLRKVDFKQHGKKEAGISTIELGK